MQLTSFTDYGLRTLIHLSVNHGRLATIAEISDAFQISKNHLLKVVRRLGSEGFVRTVRGRNGGLELARDPKEIGIGEVVRRMEPGFELVECFDAAHDRCVITGACALQGTLHQALAAFLKVLDQYTLADVLARSRGLDGLIGGGTIKV